MTPDRLPRIRVIATPIAHIVMLHVIGRGLRSVYDGMLEDPLPAQLEKLARTLD